MGLFEENRKSHRRTPDAARNPSLHALLGSQGHVKWVQTYHMICRTSRVWHAVLFVKQTKSMPIETDGAGQPHPSALLAPHTCRKCNRAIFNCPLAIAAPHQTLFAETAKSCPVLANEASNHSALVLLTAHGHVQNIQTHHMLPPAIAAPHEALIREKSKIAPSHADAARNPSLLGLLGY